ncbi:MAG: signal transduction histidine kinase [Cognaticolwellia sp.]|jgi:signal transduction histidine kinase
MHIHQRPELPLHGSFRPIVRRAALDLTIGFLPTLGLTPEEVGLDADNLPEEMAWDDFARVMALIEPRITPNRLQDLISDLKAGYQAGSSGIAMRLVNMSPDPVGAITTLSKLSGVRIFPAVASHVEQISEHHTRLWLHIPEPLTPCLGFLKVSKAGTLATFALLGDEVETRYKILDERTACMDIHQPELTLLARFRGWMRGLRGHRAAIEELGQQNALMESQLADAKRARGEALDARAAAEDALRVRKAFLRRLSHELRTPIHQCVTIMELAQTESDTLERNALLQSGRAAGWELLSTLEGLLDLSHLDGEAMALNPERVVLPQLLRGVAQGFYARAQREGRELQLDLPEELVCEVDPKRLVQMLRSLLDNAFKHGEGRVSLRAHAGLLGSMIEIDDQGEGPSSIPKLGLFEVGDEASTRTQDGLGLGLTLVPRLAKVCGGQFALSEAPGGGTRASITLPRAQPIEQAA